MKKLILSALLLSSALSFSQTVLLNENFDNTSENYPITFTGNFGISNGGFSYLVASSNYTNVSGGKFAYLNYDKPSMTINNLNTNNGYINTISFGVRIGNSGGYNPKLVVEQSSDNINWSTINFVTPPDNYWVRAVVYTNLINSGTLSIRFKAIDTPSLPCNVSIDDVVITKTTTLSTSENTLSSVKCYPNPTSEIINFDEEIGYTVYSLQGQLLKTGVGNKADVSDLGNGMYLLNLNDGEKERTVKLVKR